MSVGTFPEECDNGYANNGNDGLCTRDCKEIVAEDLALAKTVSSTTPAPHVVGNMVTFDITLTNQGNADATVTGLVDYVPAGLLLVDTNWSLA